MMDWLWQIIEYITNNTWNLLILLIGLIVPTLAKTLKRIVNALIEAFEKYLPSYAHYFIADFFFRRRYLNKIRFEHRVFNVRGLRTMGTFNLELEKVFIQLRISTANPNKLNKDLIATLRSKRSIHPIWSFLRLRPCSLWDFLRYHNWLTLTGKSGFCSWKDLLNLQWRKRRNQPVALIGTPGCGKTTLLQHIALTFVTNYQGRYGFSRAVPLLLFLRHHVHEIKEESPTLAELAYGFFNDKTRYPNLNPPQKWFEKQLNRGRCIVLLDGLDEVANPYDRQLVSAWVERQIEVYANCYFVVTSRPQGYQSAPLTRAIVLEVQPFSQKQIKKFIENWYFANEVISAGGKEDEGVLDRAKQGAYDLLNRIQKTPSLNALTINPLLLTMVAMVHRYRGQLPGRRVELYAEICDVLLGHWRASRGIQENLTAAQKRAVLEPLAMYMMKKNIREITTDNVVKVIKLPLKEVGIMGQNTKAFLSSIQESSGVIVEGEVDVWHFAHLTFQEYLASIDLTRRRIRQEQWKKLIEDSWWAETLRLYSAQENATNLVKACLNSKSVSAMTLAAACAEEALKLDADIRLELENILESNIESSDIKLRNLAIEVKLQYRLQNLQRIDDNLEVDPKPITCAEYQLFLDEMREIYKYYHPEHWLKYSYQKDESKQPILGIDAKDAEKFCQWLTSKYCPPDMEFCLPEISQIELNSKYAIWLREAHLLGDRSWLMRFKTKLLSPDYIIPLPKERNYEAAYIQAYAHAKKFIYILTPEHSRQLMRVRARCTRNAFEAILTRIQSYQNILEDGNVKPELIHALTRENYDTASCKSIDKQEYSRAKVVRTLTRDGIHDISCDLIYNRAAALAQSLERSRSRLSNRSKDRARALALDLAIMFEKPFSAEKHIQKYIENWQEEHDRKLLNVILSDLKIDDVMMFRQAWREYIITLTEYIWIDLQELPYWKRPLGVKKLKEAIQQLHWHVKIIRLREQGKIPAWETIKIVRQQKQE